MKNHKAPGGDNIITEIIKEGGEMVLVKLKVIYNLSHKGERISEDWTNAMVVLILKKGENANFQNFRPISLLSQFSTLFTGIIFTRISAILKDYQPVGKLGSEMNLVPTTIR